MSQLQFSAQLVRSLHQLIVDHDDNAEDQGIAAQYLAAAIGFMLGEQAMDQLQKRDVLEQLFAFAQHVVDDVEKQKQMVPPKQNAFGVWKPGRS